MNAYNALRSLHVTIENKERLALAYMRSDSNDRYMAGRHDALLEVYWLIENLSSHVESPRKYSRPRKQVKA